MELLLAKILIGFVVGTLIGLTGLGGGVLLLPMLIFVLHVPAIKAVGSDALFNFLTKIPAGGLHLWKGTVRRKVVLAMALGSIPGALIGVLPSTPVTNARARSAVSCPVRMQGTSSTSSCTGAGLKKCMPTTRSGLRTAWAIRVIEMVDVFDARMASGFRWACSS